MRIAENISKTRAAISERGIRDWFADVSRYLVENQSFDALKNASSVFNLDETAIFLSPEANRGLAPRGARVVYNIVKNNDKECITTLLGGNAAGQMAPPMIIFKNKIVPRNVSKTLPDGWGIGLSDSGWMTTSTFLEYMKELFYPFLVAEKIPFPVIVFIDGHRSHLAFETQEFCKQNDIWLIPLYPNTTHVLQPMDVTCFRVLKYKWREAVHDWKAASTEPSLSKECFCELFCRKVSVLWKKIIEKCNDDMPVVEQPDHGDNTDGQVEEFYNHDFYNEEHFNEWIQNNAEIDTSELFPEKAIGIQVIENIQVRAPNESNGTQLEPGVKSIFN